MATQMYFFYLVVNRAGVCTSNSSKIDINCTSRHWALTLCPEVSLVSSRHTRAGGHARAQSALLSSPPARALEGRAGRKRRRREGRWGLLSLPRAHAGPPRAWAMEGGARTMGSHRAAQLGGASRCYFPGRGAKRSCFSRSVRAGHLNFPREALRLQDSILPHLSRLSTPRGPATYPEGRFPLSDPNLDSVETLGKDLHHLVTPTGSRCKNHEAHRKPCLGSEA